METFLTTMEVLGDVSLFVVAVSIAFWGPLILKAVHDSEKSNLEQWGHHFKIEVSKNDAILKSLRGPGPDQKDVN